MMGWRQQTNTRLQLELGLGVVEHHRGLVNAQQQEQQRDDEARPVLAVDAVDDDG